MRTKFHLNGEYVIFIASNRFQTTVILIVHKVYLPSTVIRLKCVRGSIRAEIFAPDRDDIITMHHALDNG